MRAVPPEVSVRPRPGPGHKTKRSRKHECKKRRSEEDCTGQVDPRLRAFSSFVIKEINPYVAIHQPNKSGRQKASDNKQMPLRIQQRIEADYVAD